MVNLARAYIPYDKHKQLKSFNVPKNMASYTKQSFTKKLKSSTTPFYDNQYDKTTVDKTKGATQNL